MQKIGHRYITKEQMLNIFGEQPIDVKFSVYEETIEFNHLYKPKDKYHIIAKSIGYKLSVSGSGFYEKI